MDKGEFAVIMAALKTYYPKENLLPNKQAMDLWFDMLGDLTAEQLTYSLKKWVANNKWAPSIADLRAGVLPEQADWSEEWGKVLEAIRYHGHTDEQGALDSLSETTRMVVKRLGWKSLCMSDNITVDRANFRMVYEQEQKRAKEKAVCPMLGAPPRMELIGYEGA